MKSKPILTPVEVPWMVDPATPYLRLYITESSDDEPTRVEFSVVGLHLPSTSRLSGIISADGTASIMDAASRSGRNDSWYRISVKFVDGIAACLHPGYEDVEPVNTDLYDYGAVPCPYHPRQDIGEWLALFRDAWSKSGLCPDPRMYEVHVSRWLGEIAGEDPSYKHYLIVGHDAYIDVIATGWSWGAL